MDNILDLPKALAGLTQLISEFKSGSPDLPKLMALVGELGLHVDWKTSSAQFAEIQLDGAVKLKDLKLAEVSVMLKLG